MVCEDRILVFGSLNVDESFHVDHIAKPGETIASYDVKQNVGGKGLNQATALAKAGARVALAGCIGRSDKALFYDHLKASSIDVTHLSCLDDFSGRASIQVDKEGQNCIVLFGGTNLKISQDYVDAVIQDFAKSDSILLQNEINLNDYIINQAYERGLTIFLNPSPFNDAIFDLPLEKVDWFLLNEIEAAALAGQAELDDHTLDRLQDRYGDSNFIITMGSAGSLCLVDGRVYRQDSYQVPTVDTTAAGDTFTGYFMAKYFESGDAQEALDLASRASAVTVTREGASQAIPTLEEVEHFDF